LQHLEGLAELALKAPRCTTCPFWGDLFEALVSMGELERAHMLLAEIDVHRHVVERPGTKRRANQRRAARDALQQSVAILDELGAKLRPARRAPRHALSRVGESFCGHHSG
jgi:hypothetical protein